MLLPTKGVLVQAAAYLALVGLLAETRLTVM